MLQAGRTIRRGTAELLGNLKVQAPAESITAMCQAWEEQVSQKGIQASYDPHHSTDSCCCGYHFGLPLRGHDFGLLLSFWWRITPGDTVHHIEIYLIAGQDMADVDEIVLTGEECEAVQKFIDDVTDSVVTSLTRTPAKRWILYGLKGNFAVFRTLGDGHCVFRTRRNPTTHDIITVVAIGSEASSPFQNRICGYHLRVELTALLDVVLRTPVKVVTLKAPGEDKQSFPVFDRRPTEDDISTLLPDSAIEEEAISQLRNATDWMEAFLTLIASGKLREPDQQALANAIYAFRDGIRTSSYAPTLAGIAYFASLASFTTRELCEGNVTCSKCGKLPQHDLTGEANRVIAVLNRILGGRDWPRESVRKLLKEFHTKYRSAFVHGAALRMTPTDAERVETPHWPSVDDSVHPDIRAQEAIMTVESLARIAILDALATFDHRLHEVSEKAKAEAKVAETALLATIHFPSAGKTLRMVLRAPVG